MIPDPEADLFFAGAAISSLAAGTACAYLANNGVGGAEAALSGGAGIIGAGGVLIGVDPILGAVAALAVLGADTATLNTSC